MPINFYQYTCNPDEETTTDFPLVYEEADSSDSVDDSNSNRVTIIVGAIFGVICCCIITFAIFWAAYGKQNYSKRRRAE